MLFVSHDMASVRDLCQKALYLKKGEAIFWGESSKAISHYFNETKPVTTKPIVLFSSLNENLQTVTSLPSQSYLNRLRNEAVWWRKEVPHDKEAYILSVGTYNEHGESSQKIMMTKKLKMKIIFLSLIEQDYYLSVTFKNRYNQIINVTLSYLDKDQYIKMRPHEVVEFEFCFDLSIEAGQYSYQIILAQQNQFCNKGISTDQTPWLGPLEVHWDYENQKATFLGMFGIPAAVKECTRATLELS